MDHTAVLSYFPDLSARQTAQLAQLGELYKLWNAQINVISRKDFEFFYERHVLHSLAIAKIIEFKNGTRILDVGTGGGFPGIPLAIIFPEVHFTLVDSTGKKIKVVNEVAKALGLTNVTGIHARAEDVEGRFNFVVSRAVSALPKFLRFVKGKFSGDNDHAFADGIFYLKGGDIEAELRAAKRKHQVFAINDHFEGEFFETKKVVYLQMV